MILQPVRMILAFGDSLTWGWVPAAPVTPTIRHAKADRWPSAMARTLGIGYEIIVEGLSGRTTDIDDPTDARLNGAAYLPATLVSHQPLDLVIVLLGTNDTKTHLARTPLEIALGAGRLIAIVKRSATGEWTDYPPPQVLLVSPPPLGLVIGAEAADEFVGGREKGLALPALYKAVAEMAGAHFFDAGSVIQTDGVDGIHLTAAANTALGAAVAGEVRRILAP